ncbi:hypothetical protein ANCCAN_13113 [Ancylostoma caninum]|uniref:Endonuclease/exonuclease/phosphatase domain-containing protein n=1 Tax=Ancylostoma caninum TaxID=29170 RepID=A0A368G960_ANCCA|nr:hypothetical protein ANCCAN_13113 [Ancylostoma caninum]
MTVCTFNARTLASEASTKDLMMQARKIRYDVIGLAETRRHRPLNAIFDTGEELFLGTCDSRRVDGVGVLVNANLVMNIDSFGQLTTRVGRLRLRRCGSIPALTIFRRSSKPVINWGLFTSLAGLWEDAVVDNIDKEYDRLVQHLRDSAKSAEGSRATKGRLSYETLELIRQRGAARAADNYQLTSELAKRCREAIKEDLKERRAAVRPKPQRQGKAFAAPAETSLIARPR